MMIKNNIENLGEILFNVLIYFFLLSVFIIIFNNGKLILVRINVKMVG